MKNNKIKKAVQNIKISIIGPSGFFGEYEVLNQIPRVFTVKCLSSKLSTFSITKRKLVNYLQDNFYLHDFFMKKATETHLWHLNQLEKIKHDQNRLKDSHNLLELKVTKRLYNYRPIRSSVADIQEAIYKESELFAIIDNQKEKSKKVQQNNKNTAKNNEETSKTKIEITFYHHNFFRGRRILNNANKKNTETNESKDVAKTKNSPLNEETNQKKETQNLGSKIVEVVANNQKALKLLKKEKDFSSLGLFYKFFEFDKNKENIAMRHITRPISAQVRNEKESSLFVKNDIKISLNRPQSSKPFNKTLDFNEKIVNFHMRKKSENTSMNNNSRIGNHQRILSAGFQRRKSSTNVSPGVSLNLTNNRLKGILNILAYRKSTQL